MEDYNRLEQIQAKRDGAELVKNSGRGFRKGDARRGSLLIDYKFCSKGSYSLNFKAFDKHYMDAYREGFEGVVVAIPEEGKKIAMIEWEYLLQLEDRVSLAEDRLQAEIDYQNMRESLSGSTD